MDKTYRLEDHFCPACLDAHHSDCDGKNWWCTCFCIADHVDVVRARQALRLPAMRMPMSPEGEAMSTIAPAVIALQHTLDQARPGRRVNNPDGTRASAEHHKQNPNSDHEPDADHMVTAVDVHDSTVLDDGDLYESIKAAGSRNPVKYAINNGRIWSPERGEHAYHGPNAHADHCHVSVTQAGKRNTGDWFLPGITTPTQEDDVTKDELRQELQAELAKLYGEPVDNDKTHVSMADLNAKINKILAHLGITP